MKYLTEKQYTVLKGISEGLSGEEKVVVLEILKIFAYPKKGLDGKKVMLMKDIQKWLGHSQISTTEKIYAHFSEDQHKNSAALISNCLG